MKNSLFLSFLLLMFTAFVLFFLAISLGSQIADWLRYLNDSDIPKPVLEGQFFAILAPFGTAIWCYFYLLFKVAEKHCLEHMSSK